MALFHENQLKAKQAVLNYKVSFLSWFHPNFDDFFAGSWRCQHTSKNRGYLAFAMRSWIIVVRDEWPHRWLVIHLPKCPASLTTCQEPPKRLASTIVTQKPRPKILVLVNLKAGLLPMGEAEVSSLQTVHPGTSNVGQSTTCQCHCQQDAIPWSHLEVTHVWKPSG